MSSPSTRNVDDPLVHGSLDPTPDERFDRIARLAADLLDTPVALISLVDGDRLYLKSTHGLDLKEVLLKDSFCVYSIDSDDVLVVEDARADARFRENLYVTGPPHVRFYAAVPLTSLSGRHLGTLSVLAFEPRTLTERQHDHLRTLGAMALDELELSCRISEMGLSRFRTQGMIDAMRSGFVVVDGQGRIVHANAPFEQQLRQTREQIVGRDLWDTFPDLRDTPFEAHYRQAMKERTPVRFESFHPVSSRWYEVRAYPFEDGLSVYFDDVTDRRQHAEEMARLLAREQAMAQALREREEAFRALAENSPDVIARYDRDLQLRYVNPAIERQTGLARGQLLGKRTTELPGQSSLGQSLEDALRATLTTGTPLNRAFEVEPPRGLRHFEIALVPERNDAGEIVSVLTRARDVTERKRAEEQLRLLESAVTHSQDGILITDAHAGEGGPRIVYVNDAHLRLTGYTREEILGRPASLFRGTDTSPEAKARIRDAIARLEPVQAEILNYTKAGEPFWMEVHIAPVLDAAGQATHFVSTHRDVTTRKQDAEHLAVVLQRYKALSLIISAHAFAHRVEDGRLVPEWMTETVEDVLGFTRDEILAADPRTLLHPDDFTRWEERNRRLLQGHESTDDFRILCHDGTYVWLRMRMLPEFDAEGRLVRVYGASQDVTNQRKAEAELVAAKETAEEAARLKDAFLANMSHEIRTPLTAILGFSELLREEVSPDAAPIVEYIDGAGRRLMETLTSVLDLSQLRAGVMETHPAPTDVVALTRETVEILSRLAERKGLQLTLARAPATLMLTVDAAALGRVLTNLINNAIKFTEAGSVEVSIEARADRARFSVRDTGIGISDTFLPHLFAEFRQESTGLTRHHEGAGLGLSITKALVDLMGGTIEVESTPGVGTTFVVSLPRKATAGDTGDADDVHPALPEEAIPSNQPRPRLLVVEDKKPTRDLLQRVLGRHFDLVLATSASHARAVCEATPWDFDLALLDINLGEGGSGLDLLHEFRRLSCTRATRFVAMTAYALPGDDERMLEAGFDAYLPKPFSRADLYHVIAPALRKTGACPPGAGERHPRVRDSPAKRPASMGPAVSPSRPPAWRHQPARPREPSPHVRPRISWGTGTYRCGILSQRP